jgi:hypothetical protein
MIDVLQVHHALADGLGHGRAQHEGGDKVEERRPNDRDPGGKHAGGDHGGNAIGGVVEAVDEIEAAPPPPSG